MNAQSGVVAAQNPLPRPSRHVLIVGGGASGVMMATHLLSQPDTHVRVTLIEDSTALGQGIAYATTGPASLIKQQIKRVFGGPERENCSLTPIESAGLGAWLRFGGLPI